MNIPKMTSLILALMMVLTTFAACDTAETIPDGSVPITPEESAMISEMLEEGMDEEEIAEVLSTMETTEATGETNGNTDVTEPSVVESVAPNGSSVRVTPTTAPRQTVTQTIRNADGSTSTIRVTATATPRPTGTATTVPTSATTTTAPTSTTTTTAPTSASNTGKFKTNVENEMISLINNLRKAKAVEIQRTYYVPVQMSESLRNKCHTRCQEIVSNFSHASTTGTLADECIYKGSDSSASGIFNAWKNSSAHKSSLCGGCTASGKSVKNCGIGVYFYNGVAYAVFGLGSSESGTGLPSGYSAPEQTTPTTTTTSPTSTTTTATPTETTAPTTTTTTAAPTETTVVTTEATTQVQNSTVDDTGDSGGDG